MRQHLLGGLLLVLAGSAAAAPAAPAKTSNCLSNRDIRNRVATANDGYFARTSQGWWRNTGRACAAYAPNRALITRSNMDRQCRGDLVVVFDTVSRIEFGSCLLGDWVRVDGPPRKQ